MKNIVNKLRFALLLGFVAMGVTAWSQAVPYINKMSITTQMFLDEMAGRLTFDEEAPTLLSKFTSPGARQLPAPYRPIATPDTIDGKVYISAIVRVNDIGNDVNALKELGVIIQCKFDKGIVTTLIPVDKIDEVSALEGVKRIEVASVMRSLTDRSRTASNVDDVLTLSQDARNAGLLQVYDGTGVILAIIDDGVDFQHGAFKDANGNSRIVGAYCYNGSSVTADWYGSGTLPTTDDSSEDHGTHTSTTAGGSSVIVSGTTVTVTADHSQATYGGMAPGADLYLCGTQLYDTHILNSFQRMCEYADAQGKPLVVSNSWGGMMYANDGSSSCSDVLAQYFGENNPNHIALFASGNEAGKSAGGVTGGYYVTGSSTSANPLGTIIRTEAYVENYNYSYYSGILCNAWTRATDADGIAMHVYVINKSNGNQVADLGTYQSTNYNAGSYATLSTSSYFGRSFALYFDYTEANGKHQAMIYSGGACTSGTSYALAVEVYPIGGSDSTVDIWGGGFTYLAGNVTTSGHTWTAGTDDMSSTGECTNENVIAVGSYVTRNGTNSTGDISDFSSYALSSTGPEGVMLPWITAPGEVIIAGLNHYVSSHDGTVTVNNSSSPYGEMSGTSMATPAAAGIVALWMQAAQEVGKDLTMSEVKNIMAQTAIKDSWVTSGSNASHFGNGKIDALAGIQYILDNYSSTDPTIRPSSTALTYTGEPGNTYTQQVTVMGANLTGNITATLNDPSNVFGMTVTSGSNSLKANSTTTLNSGDVLTITYSPTAVGTHTGTITLTSDGAESKTITLNGTAAIKSDATVCDGTATNEFLPVYGFYYDEAQVNQMLYPRSELQDKGMDNKTIKSLTFFPTTSNNYSGINFYYQASRGNGTVTVKLANMPSGTSGYAATATRKDATFTTVKTITMPSSAQTSLTEWVFDNLENDFVYEGGDLLVEVVTEAGMYGHTYFAGKSQSSYTGYYSYGSTFRGQQFLPKVHFTYEATSVIPELSVDPTSISIEDESGDARTSETITVTSENQSGDYSTSASTNWTASLSNNNQTMTLTYNGKALHQVGLGSVSRDGLTASVDAEYLYTGPIYVIGDVNNYAWDTSNGVQLTRDEDGFYTGTISTQQSNDAAYILFTKRLGDDTSYRFGPVSNGNWWLTSELEDVYAPIDTVGTLNNIRLGAGYWFVTIDSRNNQFKIRPANVSSSVSPTEGILDFGSVTTGNSVTQTITITNDGDIAFTPSLSGLSGSFSTDYVPSELAPGQSATITITYSPNNTGNDSQSFTVSDGVNNHTWTLVGVATVPTTHGYVDSEDQAIAFGEKAIDQTYSDKVRIYNDGDVTFEPVIDVTGLDGVFTVTPTTGISIAPGEYYDLTVYFRPTTAGESYNSSFTVTIYGVTTTVTVSGTGAEASVVDNVVRSNTISVPVYKTAIEVLSPFPVDTIEADTLHTMPVDVTNSDLMVKVSRPLAITRYDVYHNEDTKVEDFNWAPGNIDDAVAYVRHDKLSGSYLPFARDIEDETNWEEKSVAPWLDTEASNMWVYLNDYVTVEKNDTWYVPVAVADGKVSKDNTYGAPMLESPLCQVTQYVIASTKVPRYDAARDSAVYYYLTAEVQLKCTAPVAPEGADYHYECYKARSWRQWTPYVPGVGSQPRTEVYLGEVDLTGTGAYAECSIGHKDIENVGTPQNPVWVLDDPFVYITADDSPEAFFVSRFYYVRVPNNSSAAFMSGGGGGPGGGGAGAPGGGGTPPGEYTGVNEYQFVNTRQVVDVMYVNPLGMTSKQPFEGVNIIVTRYDDGLTTTSKVLK